MRELRDLVEFGLVMCVAFLVFVAMVYLAVSLLTTCGWLS